MTNIKHPAALPTHVFDTGKPVITTRYLERHKNKPDRVKASVFHEGKNHSLVKNWDYSKDAEDNHGTAISALISQMDWGGPWVMGTTESGFVAVSVGDMIKKAVKE